MQLQRIADEAVQIAENLRRATESKELAENQKRIENEAARETRLNTLLTAAIQKFRDRERCDLWLRGTNLSHPLIFSITKNQPIVE